MSDLPSRAATSASGARLTCEKVLHDDRDGYLHAADDDAPYDVDGLMYCGRCHAAWPHYSATESDRAKLSKLNDVLQVEQRIAPDIREGRAALNMLVVNGPRTAEINEAYRLVWSMLGELSGALDEARRDGARPTVDANDPRWKHAADVYDRVIKGALRAARSTKISDVEGHALMTLLEDFRGESLAASSQAPSSDSGEVPT